MENLDALVRYQNLHWLPGAPLGEEAGWPKRNIYNNCLSWLDKRLIIALTGIRRTGKSTVMLQIKNKLLEEIPPERVLYFSFEKSDVRFRQDTLRQILNWYFDVFLKEHPSQLSERVYLFFDEIQYIPYWQDVVKTFYDLGMKIKFFVSGSRSLFIKKKALESLAGRIIEIIVPPLSFFEFWEMKNLPGEIETYFKFGHELVNTHFADYLTFGQFPETVRNNYLPEQVQEYLQSVKEKIIEQDLPKSYSVDRVDILKVIFEYCRQNNGAILEYSSLSSDLGVDIRTVIKYFDYLSKGYLLNLCLNQTKKLIRSTRTGKKIYLVSTNFDQKNLPIKVENYVFNWLKAKGEVKFHRYKDFEVDFVLKTEKGEVIPVEVKYQEKIDSHDWKNLIKLATNLKVNKVVLVTKNNFGEKEAEGIKIHLTPACLLEHFTSQ